MAEGLMANRQETVAMKVHCDDRPAKRSRNCAVWEKKVCWAKRV